MNLKKNYIDKQNNNLEIIPTKVFNNIREAILMKFNSLNNNNNQKSSNLDSQSLQNSKEQLSIISLHSFKSHKENKSFCNGIASNSKLKLTENKINSDIHKIKSLINNIETKPIIKVENLNCNNFYTFHNYNNYSNLYSNLEINDNLPVHHNIKFQKKIIKNKGSSNLFSSLDNSNDKSFIKKLNFSDKIIVTNSKFTSNNNCLPTLSYNTLNKKEAEFKNNSNDLVIDLDKFNTNSDLKNIHNQETVYQKSKFSHSRNNTNFDNNKLDINLSTIENKTFQNVVEFKTLQTEKSSDLLPVTFKRSSIMNIKTKLFEIKNKYEKKLKEYNLPNDIKSKKSDDVISNFYNSEVKNYNNNSSIKIKDKKKLSIKTLRIVSDNVDKIEKNKLSNSSYNANDEISSIGKISNNNNEVKLLNDRNKTKYRYKNSSFIKDEMISTKKPINLKKNAGEYMDHSMYCILDNANIISNLKGNTQDKLLEKLLKPPLIIKTNESFNSKSKDSSRNKYVNNELESNKLKTKRIKSNSKSGEVPKISKIIKPNKHSHSKSNTNINTSITEFFKPIKEDDKEWNSPIVTTNKKLKKSSNKKSPNKFKLFLNNSNNENHEEFNMSNSKDKINLFNINSGSPEKIKKVQFADNNKISPPNNNLLTDKYKQNLIELSVKGKHKTSFSGNYSKIESVSNKDKSLFINSKMNKSSKNSSFIKIDSLKQLNQIPKLHLNSSNLNIIKNLPSKLANSDISNVNNKIQTLKINTTETKISKDPCRLSCCIIY